MSKAPAARGAGGSFEETRHRRESSVGGALKLRRPPRVNASAIAIDG
jgi:hypothetical protein